MFNPDAYSASAILGLLGQLKEKMNMAVVYGGDKSAPGAVINRTHNPRSWKSYEVVAREIATALSEIGFMHVHVLPDDMSLLLKLKELDIHFVWLNTGGVQGYIPTAHAAAMLEMAGIPYVGHNPQNAAILDNKHIFKYMLNAFGLPTAPFVAWSREPLSGNRTRDERELETVFPNYAGPFIVKPTSGRASLNVNVAKDKDELFSLVDHVADLTQNMVLVEKYLPGREYCAAVKGPVIKQDGHLVSTKRPYAFSFVERVFEPGELIFTSMDKRPINDDRAHLCTDPVVRKRLAELSTEVYTRFGLETLVRIDFREDEQGEIKVIEANPKPDLKKPAPGVSSLICIGLSESGMEYNDLIASILADRLDYLFAHRRASVEHIFALLN